MDLSPVSLLVDRRNVTDAAGAPTWSNSDPGGCEAASFTIADPPRKGAPVAIFTGAQCVFRGRVDGADRDLAQGKGQPAVSCVGDRARLTDGVLAMIYVDRDLGRWAGIPASRRLSLLQDASTYEPHDDTTTERDADGAPALLHQLTGAWGAVRPITEAWYDAGPVAKLGALYWQTQDADSTVNTGDANWVAAAALQDPIGTSVGSSVALVPAVGSTLNGSLAASTPARWAFLNLLYASGAAAGVEGKVYTLRVRPVVVGAHGLPLAGSSVTDYSLRGDQIAADAAQRAGLPAGVIDQAVAVTQAAYPDPVTHESIVTDQAVNAGGWHWGVWPQGGALGDGSEFHFRAPAPAATAWVDVADIATGSMSERISGAYNAAQVSYQDAAGLRYVVTVTRPSDAIADAAITRVLQLDAGTSTATIAGQLGLFNLAAADTAQRAAGSIDLPGEVRLPGGGRKPAALLRAGIDRLRINGLSAGAVLNSSQPADTFRVARVNCNVGAAGQVTTSVELDAGADLQEVLNARLGTAG